MHVNDVTEINTAEIKVHVTSEVNTAIIIIIIIILTHKQMGIVTQVTTIHNALVST